MRNGCGSGGGSVAVVAVIQTALQPLELISGGTAAIESGGWRSNEARRVQVAGALSGPPGYPL